MVEECRPEAESMCGRMGLGNCIKPELDATKTQKDEYFGCIGSKATYEMSGENVQ